MCPTSSACSCSTPAELQARREKFRMQSWPLSCTQVDGLKEALRRPKLLRFADAEGLPLVSVMNYGEGDGAADEFRAKGSIRRCTHPMSTREHLLADAGEFMRLGHNQASCPQKPASARSSQTLVKTLRFEEQLHLRDPTAEVDRHQVCLENVFVHGLAVFGTIRVKNLAFDKTVVVRHTSNDWKTQSDLQATYITGSSNGNMDRFSFTLIIPDGVQPGSRVQFAVNFRSEAGDFWDNNDGRNYSISCHGSSRSAHSERHRSHVRAAETPLPRGNVIPTRTRERRSASTSQFHPTTPLISV